MELRSSAFEAGQAIPTRYTCDSENISPELSFVDVPAQATSLALICEDPDAPSGTFTHWVLFNIPPQVVKHLGEGQAQGDEFAWGGIQGRNDMRHNGYDGPCPPRGQTHHYHFRLFALNDSLALAPGTTRAALLKEIEGKTVASAELVGTYQRRS